MLLIAGWILLTLGVLWETLPRLGRFVSVFKPEKLDAELGSSPTSDESGAPFPPA